MNAFARVLDKIESYLAIIVAGGFAFLLVIFGICIVLLGTMNSHKLNQWDVAMMAATLVATAIFAVLECLTFNFVEKGLRADLHPLAPNLAIRQRRWPIYVKPFVTLFWLAHWTTALGLMWGLQKLISINSVDAPLHPVIYAISLVVAFGISYAGNLYLVMSVAALGGKASLVNRIWHFRFAIDLTLVAISVVVAKWATH